MAWEPACFFLKRNTIRGNHYRRTKSYLYEDLVTDSDCIVRRGVCCVGKYFTLDDYAQHMATLKTLLVKIG